ncbi:hypothetical protein L7F22_038102 [Adiantum nelumboides]|nr:hypothetical protein [Adiantum nelumboides]
MEKLAVFLESCCLPWRARGLSARSTTRRREQHMEDAFKAFDLDGDGRLSEEELYRLLASLDGTLSHERAHSIFAQADIDHDGHLDFSEFTTLLQRAQPEDDDFDKILADTFELYDVDRNGFIDAHELLQVLRKLGAVCKSAPSPPSVDDCQRMIAAHDLNGDGRIDFEEFKTLLSGSPAC